VGQLDSAIDDCNRGVELDSTNADYYISRAGAYTLIGDHEAAVADYGRALALSPAHPGICLGRGIAYLRGAEYSMAREDFTRTIELVSDSAEMSPVQAMAHCCRGMTHSKEGQWKSALDDYEASIDLDSGIYLPYAERAAEWSRRGEYDLAMDDCSRAIEIEPGCGSYAARGDVYLSMGNIDAAIADLKKATEDDQDCTRGYQSLAVAHYRAGALFDAVEACNNCLAILVRYGGDWTAHRITALLAQCEGRYTDAVEEYTLTLEKQPFAAGCYSRRGDAYHELGEAEKALEDWKKAHEIDASYPFFAHAREAIGAEARRGSGSAPLP
jgi:tetratricopeptide (TPR) repeat protein